MRKIKFRGKRIINGEWVCGDLVRCGNGTTAIVGSVVPPYPEFVPTVVPETVGQFTGLYDKNGKEIYEGDIVRFDNHLQGVSKVLYDSGQYTVESKNYSTALTYRIAIHAVIIGNIHDNPEQV